MNNALRQYVVAAMLAALGAGVAAQPSQGTSPWSGAACLTQAYPDLGVPLDYGEELQAQMAQTYPLEFRVPGPEEDPGRVRSEPFFKALYGATREQVQAQLVAVPWPPSGGSLLFSSRHGAAAALQRVGVALAPLPAAAYVRHSAGTFHWRNVAGTPRKSLHAFGVAVDFALPRQLGRYWQWSGCKENQHCAYPEAVLRDAHMQNVVRAFEQEGFIWGGKWAHYDTLHFEYRPELVGPRCKNVK